MAPLIGQRWVLDYVHDPDDYHQQYLPLAAPFCETAGGWRSSRVPPFRCGTPVVMDLSEFGEADATSLVDFASGLIVGCGGAMERLAPGLLLLLPEAMVQAAKDAQTDQASSLARDLTVHVEASGWL